MLDEDECILRMLKSGFDDNMDELQVLLDLDFEGNDKVANMQSKEIYNKVKEYVDRYDVKVEIKYKIVFKKVKLVALQLPLDCEKMIERASMQLNLRDPKKIGHEFKDNLTLNGLKFGCEDFLTKDEERCFKKMIF